MLSEPAQGSGDDSATNGLRLQCRGPYLDGSDFVELEVPGANGNGAVYGSWSSSCPIGQAVNAAKVNVLK